MCRVIVDSRLERVSDFQIQDSQIGRDVIPCFEAGEGSVNGIVALFQHRWAFAWIARLIMQLLRTGWR